jgi:hypothetical protein
LIGTCAFAQQATNTPTQQSAPAVDPALHASVLKLIDLLGMRKGLIANEKTAMPSARETLKKGPPAVTAELADEWEKRMLADTSIDAYINVAIAVYEKYFNQGEIEELIKIQQDRLDQKTPALSDALKAKLTKDGVAIQSEIIGGCTQVGARLGGEFEQELIKEHPEWVQASSEGKKTN